jgi:hypothetical protein
MLYKKNDLEKWTNEFDNEKYPFYRVAITLPTITLPTIILPTPFCRQIVLPTGFILPTKI